MKALLLLVAVVLLCPVLVAGQARTAERVVDIAFSQLSNGNPPNDSIRYVIGGMPGTSPCTGGGPGAFAFKSEGIWHCPKLTPGVGTGDVLGTTASTPGELVLFSGTNGRAIGRSNSLTGVVFVTAGVASTLGSTGTGSVVRDNTATLTAPTLLTPTIGSFANAQHTHVSATGGGQLDASSVFNGGTIPPARIITGAITNARCLRVSNVGQIEVAATDCGAGGGGSPGGVSGNLLFNSSGASGGAANTAYNPITGSLTLSQLTNGNDTLFGLRATDTTPTGNFLRFRDAANTLNIFALGVDGQLTISNAATIKNIAAPGTPTAGNTAIYTDTADKNLKAKDDAGQVTITLRATTCTGTDKVAGINSAGVVTCAADQTTPSGAGITSINTLTAADQTLTDVDDTNVTLAIGSVTSTHTFTLGWTGTMAKARQHAATAYLDAANTWTTGAQSFAAATSLTVPTAAGAGPTANGLIAYDSTANTLEYGENGNNRVVVNTAGTQNLSSKTLDASNIANLRDDRLTLLDDVDATKTVNFDLSGIATGTNRVVSIPNAASTTVQPTTATSNQFVTHIDSAGVVQKAQPSFGNLSGSLAVTQGSTGQSAVNQGDLLYGDATNSWARLPKSTAATRVLTNTGSSNNPAWAQLDLATGVTGTLSDANLSANVSLLGSSIDLSGAEATGILAAARFPALTGDVTTSSGAVATTIANDAVSNAKLANMATATFKGRTTSGTGDPEDLTATQATALLNTFTTTLKGLVPSPGSTTNAFLRDDGTWVIPPGVGDMVLAGVQTVTGTKTFDATKLVVGSVSTDPAVVIGAFYRDSDDGKLYLGVDDTVDFWGEFFIAGQSVLNLASANVTGALPLANGGTNQTSWTAGRCVQVNAGGTALESASAACGSGSGANTALSNLAAVAINTSLLSNTNNNDDLGSSSIAWRTAYLGTSIELGHASDTTLTRSAAGVVAVEGVTVTRTITNGTSALGTSAIASGACASAVTTTATGTATTDAILWGFNGDPTSTTGYQASANGMLTIIAYPSTNNVNFKVCNNTASSITPGAVTLNWRIVR